MRNRNKIFESIISSITEEYGVDIRVVVERDRLLNKINAIFSAKENFSFETIIFGETVEVAFRVIDFDTIDEFNFNRCKCYSYVDAEQHVFQFVFPSIHGVLLRSYVSDVLQHELSHYNEIVRGLVFSDESNGLYHYCVSIIRDKNRTQTERDIAYALYCSFQTEQTALANGLDACFSSFIDTDTQFEIIKKCPIYRALSTISSLINKENNINDKTIENLFGFSKKRYFKIIKQARKNLLHRIGKIVIKNNQHIIS